MGVVASGAPIDFAGTSTYTQDFQTMTTTATTSAVLGLTMTEVSTLSGGSSGVQGWYIYGGSGSALSTIISGAGSDATWTGGVSKSKWLGADKGSSSTGGFRELIDTASPVVGRALGSEGSGSAMGFFGLVLKNTSGATIKFIFLGLQYAFDGYGRSRDAGCNYTAFQNRYDLRQFIYPQLGRGPVSLPRLEGSRRSEQ
ncbi:MAG: hypothetical protein EBU04_05360 [Verrucomicrobia bacterium]|nr:hypothetical protein [Verrucomicrobiota bacterium]